jgi:ribosome-binding protein aMBF1 (putative translation factor)
MLSGEQVKNARRLLRWSQEKLALEAQLRQATVAAVEAGNPASQYTVSCIKRALEVGGVETFEIEPDSKRSTPPQS